jgi:hypothetical protein
MTRLGLLSIILLVTFVLESVVTNDLNHITLDKIQINEELDQNYLIQNLTETIVNRAKLALPYDSQSVKLDSVKFLSDKVDLNEDALNVYEFFSIDLKKFRLFLLNENGLSSSKNLQTINNNQTTIVLLKAGSKKLDREYLCRAKQTAQLRCSCENECLIDLELMASFYLPKNASETEITNEMIQFQFTVPIEVLDVNDNKPFFYQNELVIDVDQFEEELHYDLAKPGESFTAKIPLKLAFDLDSTERNRILSYELENQTPKVKLTYKSDMPVARLSDDTSQLYLTIKLTENFQERFKLVAYDYDFSTYQNITIKYSKFKPTTTPRSSTSSTTILNQKAADLLNQQQEAENEQQSVNFNLVSAINEIDIRNNFDIYFRTNNKLTLNNTSTDANELLTIAYLLLSVNDKAQKNSDAKLAAYKKLPSTVLNLEFKQYLENSNELSEANLNIFQV